MAIAVEVQNKIVNGMAAVPFVTFLGVDFMSFNEFMEGATLTIGFITGVFALAFQVRRYFRSRKRDKLAANEAERKN
jgi:hypothetical protein